MQILIVEDEQKIANLLRRGLLEDHYNVAIANNGEEALIKINDNAYDLVILDLMIPKIDGLTVCKKIREDNTQVLILILTAKDDVNDKIAGLDAGADDYVVKPFSIGEIAARIRALLRRGRKADATILSVADVTLNPATKIITRDGIQISLTAREYALLEYFMRNKNRILAKQQLLEHVWDYEYEGFSNIVETYVKYLRKKLKIAHSSKDIIHTKRGIGYIMKE